jgi:hypothetical protein
VRSATSRQLAADFAEIGKSCAIYEARMRAADSTRAGGASSADSAAAQPAAAPVPGEPLL